LLGGFTIWQAAERLSPSDPAPLADMAVAGALVLNVLLFLNFFPLPAPPATPSAFQSLKNATAYALYESSLGWERSTDDVAAVTMAELKDFTGPSAASRPWVIVTTDETPKEWFMHWLLLRYYAPEASIWVAAEGRSPSQVLYTKAGKTLETRTGDVMEIPIPRGGRVIWVLEPGAAFQKELQQVQQASFGRRVGYTDVPADGLPFQIRRFKFVPTAADYGIQ
jgi:hypothetical protein